MGSHLRLVPDPEEEPQPAATPEPAPPPWLPAVSRRWTRALEMGLVSANALQAAAVLQTVLQEYLADNGYDLPADLDESERKSLERHRIDVLERAGIGFYVEPPYPDEVADELAAVNAARRHRLTGLPTAPPPKL